LPSYAERRRTTVPTFTERDGAFEWQTPDETVRIEAWGPHSVRVRCATRAVTESPVSALDTPEPAHAEATLCGDGTARLVNGRLTMEVDAAGRLRFVHTATGRELLAEQRPHTWYPGPRVFAPRDDGTYRVEQHFAAYDGERLYGLGQHLHGRLDQKGCVIDLVQGNTVVTIPFLYSSRGYGLLWNNPAMGRVELGADVTRWVAEESSLIDYWVTAGDSPADVLAAYTGVTGRPPLLPEWAAGFWQSKLRYRTQEELLDVAREYQRRDLPLSVIVCDFFHWPHMGDWRFDEAEWPDAAAMVKELDALGVRLAVSVWPTVDPDSDNHAAMRAAGYLVADRHGGLLSSRWPAKGREQFVPMAYYDATNPDARRFLWEQVREHYHALGVAAFWLDACEPDLPTNLAVQARYAAGTGVQVGNAYGLQHVRGFAEGLRETGDDRPLSLVRSAWAGSQRHGAALWSGDIPPTFDSLTRQVCAGLNVAMSGIPWWNTDIGGFQGGDPDDPAYREVLIRWFQYGTFSPIMRLHGDRQPNQPFHAAMTGGPNEVWSYGEQAYQILREHLLLRERLRPYVMRLAEATHRTGAPVMRPLFFDFPHDEAAWGVDDQFMFGPDLLVAPITEAGVRGRAVYLPSGTRWAERVTGTIHDGGSTVQAEAPLERIPVYLREGAAALW
jgi:alpha-D-xyloside xylohydrolase